MRRKGQNINGVLLLDKPYGVTSNAALQGARRAYNAKKAGHTGTLDPLASGLLPVTFGEATKFSADLLEAEKTYIAGVKLGVKSTTGDLEGELFDEKPVNLTMEAIETTLARFRGDIQQVPPMFSALKRDGQTLYDLARAGVEIEREARTVHIAKLVMLAFEEALLTIEVTCSKGTYIRVLAQDIGEALGCGAHLASLRRTRVGDLDISDAVALEAVKEADADALSQYLMPVDALLQTLPVVQLEATQADRFKHGQRIPLGVAAAPRVRVYGADKELLGTARINDHGVLQPERLMANQ